MAENSIKLVSNLLLCEADLKQICCAARYLVGIQPDLANASGANKVGFSAFPTPPSA